MYQKSTITILGVHFYRNFAVELDDIQYVATTCWFVEARAKSIFAQVLMKDKHFANVIL